MISNLISEAMAREARSPLLSGAVIAEQEMAERAPKPLFTIWQLVQGLFSKRMIPHFEVFEVKDIVAEAVAECECSWVQGEGQRIGFDSLPEWRATQLKAMSSRAEAELRVTVRPDALQARWRNALLLEGEKELAALPSICMVGCPAACAGEVRVGHGLLLLSALPGPSANQREQIRLSFMTSCHSAYFGIDEQLRGRPRDVRGSCHYVVDNLFDEQMYILDVCTSVLHAHCEIQNLAKIAAFWSAVRQAPAPAPAPARESCDECCNECCNTCCGCTGCCDVPPPPQPPQQNQVKSNGNHKFLQSLEQLASEALYEEKAATVPSQEGQGFDCLEKNATVMSTMSKLTLVYLDFELQTRTCEVFISPSAPVEDVQRFVSILTSFMKSHTHKSYAKVDAAQMKARATLIPTPNQFKMAQ